MEFAAYPSRCLLQMITVFIAIACVDAANCSAQGGPPLYGMHEIELKAGVSADAFEKFVREEFAPAWVTPVNGLQLVILKGERGAREGKYQLVFAFSSIEDRSRHFPAEAAPTDLYRKTMQPRAAVFDKLGEFLADNADEASYTDYFPIVPSPESSSVAMPAMIRENINRNLAGHWTTTIKRGDQTLTGTFSATWLPGQSSLLIQQSTRSDEGTTVVSGLLGWVEKNKTLVHNGQTSDGKVFSLEWSVINDDKWAGTGHGTDEQGDWTSPTTVTVTGDTFHYEDRAHGELITIDARRN